MLSDPQAAKGREICQKLADGGALEDMQSMRLLVRAVERRPPCVLIWDVQVRRMDKVNGSIYSGERELLLTHY